MNQRTTRPEEQVKYNLEELYGSPAKLLRQLLSEHEWLSALTGMQLAPYNLITPVMMTFRTDLPTESEADVAVLQLQFGQSNKANVERALTYSILDRVRASILIAENFKPEHLAGIRSANKLGLRPVVAIQADLTRPELSPWALELTALERKPEAPAPTEATKKQYRDYWAAFSAAAGTSLHRSLRGQPDSLSQRSVIWCFDDHMEFNVALSSHVTRITLRTFHPAVYNEIQKHRDEFEAELATKLILCTDTKTITTLAEGGYESNYNASVNAVAALTHLHDALTPVLKKLPLY